MDEQNEIQLSLPHKYKKILWISLIAVSVITAALLVYIVYFRNNNQEAHVAGDVSLAIEAPGITASGSEISYEILIKNLTRVRLGEVQLEVFYPLGFIFLDSTPDPAPGEETAGRKFALPGLAPQGEQRVVVVGTLEGSLREIKVIGAKLHYVPENFRSSFAAEARATTEVMAPDLSFRLTAPSHLVTGQKINYEMQITNISSRAFAAILVRMNYPETFVFGESSPPPSIAAESEWEIVNLGVSESRSITASGIISEHPDREVFASADLFIRDSSGAKSPAGRSFAFTQILSSPLILSHRLVKAESAALPGEELKYEIVYENISRVGLNNTVISLIFETATVDLLKASSAKGQLVGRSIVFFPAAIPELLVVDPGESGKFDLRVPVLSLQALSPAGGSGFGGQKNPTVKSRIEFHSREFPEEIAGNILEIKLGSVLEVEALGTALGGHQYRIDLEVRNGVNDLRDAVLLATIPSANAVFLAETAMPQDERDNVQFIPDAGAIRWDLGRVFAFSGSFHEPRRLSFILSFTAAGTESPTQAVTLLQNVEAEGVDEFTGNKIVSKKIDTVSSR